MEDRQAIAALEAVLFLKEDPLSARELSDILELPERKIRELAERLRVELQRQQRGIQLLEIAGGYQLASRADYERYTRKLFTREKVTPLSQAALETLAIIAYKQPVTRLEIENIRGVKVDRLLENLISRKLIRIVGFKQGIGRPRLYGTTREFLAYFGLPSLDELPPLEATEY